MKKILYLFLALSFSFTSCSTDDDDTLVPTVTITDSLSGSWQLTHYDIGSGLESADSGQYINFLNDEEYNVNVQITGWTWYGDFNYEATSDSLITMNQEIAIIDIDDLNLHLRKESSFSLVYDLYF